MKNAVKLVFLSALFCYTTAGIMVEESHGSRVERSTSQNVELHEHRDRLGRKLIVQPRASGSCIDLPSNGFNDMVTSVRLNGQCIYLHEHHYCGGEYLRLSPGNMEDCQISLVNCGWNDKASSVSFC